MASTASEASSLQRMTIRGAQLAYNDIGQGQPLVLVHANISDIRSWDSVTPQLAKKFRVIAYSRRYAWPNDEISDKVADPWEDHADDLEAIIEKLDIAPAHLLGNSTGATVALILANKRPDLVKSLILEEPPLISLFLPITPPSLMDVAKLLWFHPWSFLPTIYFGATVIGPTTNAFKRGDNEAALKVFSRGVLGYGFDQRLSNARREQMRDNSKPHRALLCHGEMPKILDSDVQKVNTPALVITGEMTVLSQRHINRRLAVLLSNAREVEICNASHLMHEDQPEEVARVVVEFVSAMS
jgi:pimeloyl-ACP methyl ester carboxylesterase